MNFINPNEKTKNDAVPSKVFFPKIFILSLPNWLPIIAANESPIPSIKLPNIEQRKCLQQVV